MRDTDADELAPSSRKTDPSNLKPDAREEAFIRIEKKVDQLYAMTKNAVEAFLTLSPKVARHEERLAVIEAELTLIKARLEETSEPRQ